MNVQTGEIATFDKSQPKPKGHVLMTKTENEVISQLEPQDRLPMLAWIRYKASKRFSNRSALITARANFLAGFVAASVLIGEANESESGRGQAAVEGDESREGQVTDQVRRREGDVGEAEGSER